MRQPSRTTRQKRQTGSQHRMGRRFEPQPLRQRGCNLFWNGRLQLIYGPERIEDNWWREPVSRDYYIASDTHGLHYWIYRDRLVRTWFIHGIFA